MTGTLDRWASHDVAALRAAWRVPALVALARTASTNDVARSLAEQGAEPLTCVLADEQTAGRGRQGRAWSAPPGSSLLISIVLRTAAGPGAAPSAVPLRIGMATAAAIEAACPVSVTLKWPNDLFAGDRKLGGVLCEASTGPTGTVVIAGIGINVLQTAEDWPPALRGAAVSLREATGRTVDRALLAGALVEEIRCVLPRLDRPLDASERALWDARDAFRNRDVIVDGDEAGTVDGIAEDGALRLRTSRGARLIRSGTVRLRATVTQEDR